MKTYKIRAAVRRTYAYREYVAPEPMAGVIVIPEPPAWVMESGNPAYERALWERDYVQMQMGRAGLGSQGCGENVGYGYSVQW